MSLQVKPLISTQVVNPYQSCRLPNQRTLQALQKLVHKMELTSLTSKLLESLALLKLLVN